MSICFYLFVCVCCSVLIFPLLLFRSLLANACVLYVLLGVFFMAPRLHCPGFVLVCVVLPCICICLFCVRVLSCYMSVFPIVVSVCLYCSLIESPVFVFCVCVALCVCFHICFICIYGSMRVFVYPCCCVVA